jgi:glycosyltransferase involved in cell wall biosynthesis
MAGGHSAAMQQATSVLADRTMKSIASSPLSLQIGIQFGGGGEGRVISELSKFLPAAGFRVIGAVAEPDNIGELTECKFVNFAPTNATKIHRFRSARQKIIRILKEERPAIVASHFALYALPAFDKIHFDRLITHFHGPWGAESAQDGAGAMASSARMLVEKSLYLRSARVIVLSKAFAQLAAKRYGVDPAKIRIVPGCVDIERFDVGDTQRAARIRLGLPTDRPILLSIRRLVRRMGLVELVACLPEVRRYVPDVLLCIAGRGLLREELERQVDQLGLTDHVRFLGYMDDEDLPYLYRSADINVVPTAALEGFGLVAAESLAAGVPAMVTKVGGLPEVVGDLLPELMFASPGSEDLASGLIDALLGRLRLPDRATCAAYAKEHFSSRLMAERVAAVYQEIL